MSWSYSLFGLTWRSEFACSALRALAGDPEPDVLVSAGEVPRALPGPQASSDQWDALPGRFLFRGGRRAGRFLVEDGARVTVELNPAAEPELVAFCLLTAVMAAVLRQRGVMVFHANAAVTPRGVVAVAGVSGAGKSTALAALMDRGCRMVADDVTALRPCHAGGVEVLPGVPCFHLTDESANGLGRDLRGLRRRPQRVAKAAVPAGSAMATEPAPLCAVYQLGTHAGSRVRVEQLAGSAAFELLQECVYGPLLPSEHPAHFPVLSAVSAEVPVYRLDRPAEGWSADAVAEALLDG